MSLPLQSLSTSVGRNLRKLGFRQPSQRVLDFLLYTMYLASLKTEEGRVVHGSITFANPRYPDLHRPRLQRASYPSFTPFSRSLPFTVESIVKLARAIDQWSGSIAVY
jgi:hypothetical protein